jgi:hypothetical protein
MPEDRTAARLRRRSAVLSELERARTAPSRTVGAWRRHARRRAVFQRVLLLPAGPYRRLHDSVRNRAETAFVRSWTDTKERIDMKSAYGSRIVRPLVGLAMIAGPLATASSAGAAQVPAAGVASAAYSAPAENPYCDYRSGFMCESYGYSPYYAPNDDDVRYYYRHHHRHHWDD